MFVWGAEMEAPSTGQREVLGQAASEPPHYSPSLVFQTTLCHSIFGRCSTRSVLLPGVDTSVSPGLLLQHDIVSVDLFFLSVATSQTKPIHVAGQQEVHHELPENSVGLHCTWVLA